MCGYVVNAHADGRAGIDAALVKRLVATQFPQWGHLPVAPVEVDGWDNRTYRLGDEMTVRLPTHENYAPAVEKEDRWLPVLGPSLPVPIPVPLEMGVPGEGYPFNWSIRAWLTGETASVDRVPDLNAFALAVADFILALQRIDPVEGPRPGAHSFYRGESPLHYDDETRRCLAQLDGHIDTAAAAAVWDAALNARADRPAVWFHGDIATGNLLVRDGKLAAVIDFGTSGVGDPACDLVIAWTFFRGHCRAAFRQRVAQDEATWARARGWALWKALIGLAHDVDRDPTAADINHEIINEILLDAAGAAPR